MKHTFISNNSIKSMGSGVDYLRPASCPVDSALLYSKMSVTLDAVSHEFLERGIRFFNRHAAKHFAERCVLRDSIDHDYVRNMANEFTPALNAAVNRIINVHKWYLRLCDLVCEYEDEIEKRCEKDILSAKESSSEPLEPQSFDMSGMMSRVKGMLTGFLEELGANVIANHRLCSVIFRVILIFVHIRYLSQLSLGKQVIISMLAWFVHNMFMVWMSKLSQRRDDRIRMRNLKRAFLSRDKKAFMEICQSMMGFGDVLEMEYWFDGAWKQDFMPLLKGCPCIVEEPESDDESDTDSEVELEPQIGGGQAAFVGGAMYFLTKRIPLYRAVVDHDKLQRNLAAMYCGSVGSLERVLNTVLKVFGKKQVVLLKAHEKVVNDWERSVRLFVDKIRLGTVSPMSAVAQMEYDRHRDQGLGLEHLHKDPQNRAVIKRGMDSLSSVACYFAIRGDCTSRMEPLVLCLSGSAGVGKTTLARMMSVQLSKYMCSEDEISAVGGDLSKLCFQKGTSEYWEGYCGQPICVMDDWLQAIPETGIENEVVNLIRAANQWPYPLNMASLDMKGKVNFTSRAILMTTNVTNNFYVSKVVTCPAAVARRMDMCYTVTVKPAFLRGNCLDVAKLAAINAKSVADYDDVWNFSVLDMMKDGTKGTDYTISQVVSAMRTNYDRRIEAENNTRDFVKNFAELPVEPQILGLKTVAAVGAGVVACVAAKCAVGTAAKLGRVVAVGKSVLARCKRAAPLFVGGAIFLAYELISKIVAVVAAFARCLLEVFKTFLGLLGFKRKSKKLEPQAAVHDPVLDRMRKNMTPVYATFKHGKARIPIGFATFLTARHLVVPYHFMREVRANVCSIHVKDVVGDIDLSQAKVVKEAALVAGGIRDFCILDIGRNFTGMRDVRSHFASVKQVKNTAPGFLVKGSEVVPVVVGCVMDTRSYANILSERVALIQHSGHTVKGDCGSVLMLRNQSEVKRVRGIHVAGLDYGYYCPLYAEDMPDYVESQAFCGLEEVRNVSPLHNNGSTGIAKTGYSGFFVEPKGGPACLRPALNAQGELVDPMLSVVERSHRDFDSIILPEYTDLCISAVVGEIFDDIGGEDLSFLPYEEAVAGIPGDDFIKGIARGKSMGYPLCTKYANKRPAFGAEGPYVFDTPAAAEVREQYDSLVADYRAGKKSAIFRDCLKDEVLRQEKVDNVDTRLISASPVHFTILVKQLFGRFAAQFMRKRLKHGALVGVNVYSPEWSVVSNELRSMNASSSAAAGDYKAFDKSQHPHIIKGILMELARRLPHYADMRDLFEGVANDTAEAFHLGGNSYKSWVIYKIIGSLPSGHPLTSILNSIYNLVVFRMCWCDMYGPKAVLSFRDKVRCYVYGDDNIFAPADDCLAFNLEAMAKFCPKIGMVYTSEDKSDSLYTLKPVGACSFLKRKFSLDPDGYVYAPLEYYSIGDMLNWRKKKTTDEEHLEQVSEAIIREVSAYEFGVFADTLGRLRSLLRQVGVRDPTRGVGMEYAYVIARSWYRGYTPVWSIDE